MVARERLVERAQQFRGARVVRAHHNAVRLHEVADGGAFLQELRVRYHVEFRRSFPRGERLLQPRAHFVGGAHRHRALGNDNLVAVHVLADGFRHREHVAQVRAAVFVGRRAHSNELEQAMVHARLRVGGELQAALRHIAGDEFIEPWLVDGHPTRVQQRNLARVHVYADDMVAHFRQAGARNQPYITRAEDGEFHSPSLPGKSFKNMTVA